MDTTRTSPPSSTPPTATPTRLVQYGTLGFTPEMSTWSDSDPNDEWEAEDCVSGFIFPDDEDLIQAEFEKNIPFALAVAQSTHDRTIPSCQRPSDPTRPTSLPTRSLFLVQDRSSAGRGRSVRCGPPAPLLDQRPPIDSEMTEWQGGERYGDTHDDYYGVPCHDHGTAW